MNKTSTGKIALLLWIQKIAIEYGIKVENFTTHFQDGRVFCALVNYYFPDELDFQNDVKTDTQEQILNNHKLAFDIAEKHGLYKILDPEDMLTPDRQSVMTYCGEMNKLFKPLPKGVPKSKREEALKETVQSEEFSNLKQNILQNVLGNLSNIQVSQQDKQQENQSQEIENQEKERQEKENQEKERLERERLEKENQERERLERENQEKIEKERLERERLEKENQERERLERENQEKQRLERERLEKERQEKERQEKESQERERQETSRIEKERQEKEHQEKERLERERQEKENQERERQEKERLEKEKQEKERLERERQEKENQEKERQELERLEKQEKQAIEQQLEKERQEKQKQEREREQRERKEVKEEKIPTPVVAPFKGDKFHPAMLLTLVYLIAGYMVTGILIYDFLFSFYTYLIVGIMFGISKWKPQYNYFPLILNTLPYILSYLGLIDAQLIQLAEFIKNLMISHNLFKVQHNIKTILSILSSSVISPFHKLLGIQAGGWSLFIFFAPRVLGLVLSIIF